MIIDKEVGKCGTEPVTWLELFKSRERRIRLFLTLCSFGWVALLASPFDVFGTSRAYAQLVQIAHTVTPGTDPEVLWAVILAVVATTSLIALKRGSSRWQIISMGVFTIQWFALALGFWLSGLVLTGGVVYTLMAWMLSFTEMLYLIRWRVRSKWAQPNGELL